MSGGDGRRSSMLVFGRPDIRRDEIDEVVATLESGWIGTGPRVARFEREFARSKGVEPDRVAALASCTAALHVSLLACQLEPGDEVITTPLTFCATVNAILHAGATPVLADVDPASMNVDPERVEAAVTPRTKVLLPVHFAGRPAAMGPLLDIARRHDLRVIEDCAHAIETTCDGRPAGTLGDFGCFSFYATKNLTTAEGGLVIARRPEDAGRIRQLALHGLSRDAWRRFGDDGFVHYEVEALGFKYNLTDLQAAIGLHQLRRLDASWSRRLEIWRCYQEALADLPLELPAALPESDRHALHLYTVLVDPVGAGPTRDELLGELARRHIGAGVHYLSIPEHRYYRERFGWSPEHYPNAMRIGRRTLSLPLSPALADADVEDVIAALRACLGA